MKTHLQAKTLSVTKKIEENAKKKTFSLFSKNANATVVFSRLVVPTTAADKMYKNIQVLQKHFLKNSYPIVSK